MNIMQHDPDRAAGDKMISNPSNRRGVIGDTNRVVLIGEANNGVRSLLKNILASSGFSVQMAKDARELLREVKERPPALVLFQIPLSDMAATDLCLRLRREAAGPDMAIVVLRPGSSEEPLNELVAAGATDCISSPFSTDKVSAYLRSVIQRQDLAREASASAAMLRFRGVEMDLTTNRVVCNGQVLHVSRTSFRLLKQFLLDPHRVHLRKELKDAVWPNLYLGPRTLDVHVGRLRKILRDAGEGEMIRTVRSIGYVLN